MTQPKYSNKSFCSILVPTGVTTVCIKLQFAMDMACFMRL